MDITKRAEEYAANKAQDCLTKMIAQAYEDGYRDGYNESRETMITNIAGDAGEFVDLGLPSGTLWSADYLQEQEKCSFRTYNEAVRSSIPSLEQWRELRDLCEWIYTYTPPYVNPHDCGVKAKCIGPNGKELFFKNSGFIMGETLDLTGSNVFFWLKSEKQNLSENVKEQRAVAHIDTKNDSINCGTDNKFIGLKLPVRLVKTR